jgi:hypothetical protein
LLKRKNNIMKKIILDDHTECCKNKPESDWLKPHLFCKVNPSRFVFYYDRQFIYLEIPNCRRDFSNDVTFLENMLLAGNESAKRVDKYETYRSQFLDGKFKEHRLRSKELDLKLIEVNYTYSDATGKEYAICTDITLDEALKPNEAIEEDGKKMKDFLDEIGQEYLSSQVDELISQNKYYISDYEIIKTSEHLLKQFNKKIKQL